LPFAYLLSISVVISEEFLATNSSFFKPTGFTHQTIFWANKFGKIFSDGTSEAKLDNL